MKKIAKAKAGTSLGMKSVKAGYDSNPGVTRADIISAGKMKAGKAKNGTKVAAKKPIKKAQNGAEKTKMVVDGKEYKEGSMLPEAVVTGKPIKSLKDRVKSVKDKVESIGDGLGLNRSYKPKPAKRSVLSVKTYRQRGSGPGSGLMKLKQRITRRYEEGGKLSKAQDGTTENRLNKDQKQGLFNKTLVQGGSKNPAMNPEKYYPSMYGKGRVGDKPAPKVTKSKTGSSIKKSMGKCKMGC
jgi:hypothetical protein